MSYFNDRHNHSLSSLFPAMVVPEKFHKLAELAAAHEPDEVFGPVTGILINRKSRYGTSVALTYVGPGGEANAVNLPAHRVEEMVDAVSNPDDVRDINSGDVYFCVKPYQSKRYGTCYDVVFTDV